MKTKKEKQLEIALLKEKVQRMTGKKVVFESLKGARQRFLDTNKIPEEVFTNLLKIDRTPTKKYIEWICKIYLNENPDLSQLENVVTEYDAFVNTNRVEEKDIEKFKTFKDLADYVDQKNQEGPSKSQKENEYKIILNTPEIFVVVPFSHEASRKIGFKWFAVKKNTEGVLDCPWCIGYKNDTHWESYWGRLDTFYYIKINGKLKDEIVRECGPTFTHCALQVNSTDITVWDKTDSGFSQKSTPKGKSYMRILENYLVENNLVDKFSNI
jgi:hypothetical protein